MSAAQLAGLVSSKVKLIRHGNIWTGLCPFHEEKHPSFRIFEGKDGKARYYCHGCGEKGDAVNWLRVMEGMSYQEAVKALQGSFQRRPSREVTSGRRREKVLQAFRDRHPDSPLPDWAIDTD